MPDPARPDHSCRFCRGAGHIVVRDGEHAAAQLCRCVPPCERCGGTGVASVEQDGAIKVGRCLCQRLPDRIRLFNQAGIPARFSDATLESFAAGANARTDNDKFAAVPAVATWLGRFEPGSDNRGLLLSGKVGRGKTHLLVAILRTLVFQHGVRVRFMEFSRLLGLLREGYGEGRSDAPLLNELATVPILAIDELGKGRMTEWELAIVDDIIGRRYNALGCTLGSTNFAPSAPTGALPPNLATAAAQSQTLGDRVGDRIWSRLVEMCDFVEVGGLDFRGPF